MKLKNKIKSTEISRYLIIGILTTLINLIIYQIGNVLGINYVINNTLAFVGSVTFAFVYNKKYVFLSIHKGLRGLIKEIMLFFTTRIGTFFIDIFLMIYLIEIVKINDFVAKCLVNILVIVINYVISKIVIFKK